MTLVKECLLGISVLLLLSFVTTEKKDASLDFKPYNSSVVDVTCRYEGKQTNIEFLVHKVGILCFRYIPATAIMNITLDCSFQWKETGDPNILSFLVHLTGSCEENTHIECVIVNSDDSDDLYVSNSLTLMAQSDIPEISIEQEEQVEVGLRPIPITCTVSNRCKKTDLEISGGYINTPLDTYHTKHGGRFNTTAKTTAVFIKPGNYTIVCKETGKGKEFSKNLTIEVKNTTASQTDEDITLKDDQSSGIWKMTSIFLIVLYVMSIVTVIFRRKILSAIKRKCKDLRQYIKGPARPDTTGSLRNREENSHLLESGTSKEEGKTDNNRDLEEASHPPKSGNVGKEGETDNNRDMDEGAPLLENRIDGKKGKTDNNRSWSKLMKHIGEDKTLQQWNVDELTSFIRDGQNPFASIDGVCPFNLFLEKSRYDPNFPVESASALIEMVLEKGDFSIASNSSLNDVVKSISTNFLDYIRLLVKVCHELIDKKPTVRDHEDSEGRTPIHNLMRQMSIDSNWQMSKLNEGTDSVLELIPDMITTTNVHIKDKDNVTPYSWASLWRESVAFQDLPNSDNLSQKIDGILQKLDESGAIHTDALEGLTYLRKTQNTMKTICGIWIESNKNIGQEISYHIETCQNRRRVHEARTNDLSFFKKGSNYRDYFAVISTQSLENHEFCQYLMTVLRCLAYGKLRNKITFVLVVVDKDAVSLLDDAQDKKIHWPIDLKAIPRVDAHSQMDDDILNQIASKLQGPPLDLGVSQSVGNVGIGLAWRIFQYHFAYVLPGITERIAKSEAYKKYEGKMSKCFIIIIPESREIELELEEEGIPRRKLIGDLDGGITIERDGWTPTDNLQGVVGEITNSQGNCCYCCYRYISVYDALKYMLESGELTDDEVKKQYTLCTDTIKKILHDPLYHNDALVFNCKDYSTLPDNLCDLIIKQNKQPPLRIDTNPRNQVARVAEGLARDYYHFYVEDFGPGLKKGMETSKFYRQREMPAKYFILMPYSCVIQKLDNAEQEGIKYVGFCAGKAVYRISNGRKTYCACADYCRNLQVLHEMETGEIAALTPVQKAAELRIFYEVLNYLFTRPSAPDWCRLLKLVYYDDDEQTGRRLSEVLMDEIKKSMREELDGGS